MNSIFDKLLAKSCFPEVINATLELKKIGIYRIILGIIIFSRFIQIAQTYYLIYDSIPIIFVSTLILIVCFTLGFLTPISTIFLIYSVVFFDSKATSETLGTTILIQVLLLFLFTNGGNFYSIDRFLFKRCLWFNKTLSLIYSFAGKPTTQSIRKSYFLIFILYGVASLAALSLHIKDNYWTTGLTTKSLLSNAFLCDYYFIFRNLEKVNTTLYSFISICSGIFQSIFQFFMLGLVFFKIGRVYVFLWGMMFYITSLFFINLSYLPHIEIIIWLIIFLPIKKNDENVTIFYDDFCSLCKKAMKLFKYINFNGKYNFIAISTNQAIYSNYNLTEKDVKSYMAGKYKEKIYVGFDLYVILIRCNPLLWILFPIFMIGKYTRIGYLIYNYIAEKRFKFFETCEISYEDDIKEADTPLKVYKNFDFSKVAYFIYSAIIIYFLIFSFTPIQKSVYHKALPINFIKLFKQFGIETPNVFNETDLSMGNKWMVIYRKNNEKYELTPLIGENGERLDYTGINFLLFSNHNSDILYFGTTLRQARDMIELKTKSDLINYYTQERGKKTLLTRLIYDYKINNLKGEVNYKAVIYASNSSKATHDSSSLKRHKKEKILTFELLFNGANISIINNEYDTLQQTIPNR